MSPLSVIPDRVSRLHSDPLWYWPILSLLFSKLPLDSESFVRRLNQIVDRLIAVRPFQVTSQQLLRSYSTYHDKMSVNRYSKKLYLM